MKKYILGLFTGLAVIPIAESLLDVVYAWIEVAKTKPASIVNKWNKNIMSESSDGDVSVIGFQIPSEEEYDNDD